MTVIEIKLPDELAMCKGCGLALGQRHTTTPRRRYETAGWSGQLDAARQIHASDIPLMSDEEILAEVRAVRAERRSRDVAP